MSSSFYDTKLIKNTKRLHKCYYCCNKINPSSSCYQYSGKDQSNNFYSFHMCVRCHNFIEIYRDELDLDDGISENEFWNELLNTIGVHTLLKKRYDDVDWVDTLNDDTGIVECVDYETCKVYHGETNECDCFDGLIDGEGEISERVLIDISFRSSNKECV